MAIFIVIVITAAALVWRIRDELYGSRSLPEHTIGLPAAGSWVRVSDRLTQDPYARIFLGNGRIGTTLAGVGHGYESFPGRYGSYPLLEERYTGTFIAGLYNREVITPRIAQFGGDEHIAALPAWSGLTVSVEDHEYIPGIDPETISNYRQTLDEKNATATTEATWAADEDHVIDLRYTAFVSRNDPNLAVISVELKPRFSGIIRVTDLLDGRASRRVAPQGSIQEQGSLSKTVVVRTTGEGGRTAAVSSVLVPAPESHVIPSPEVDPGSTATTVEGELEENHHYTFTKFVGIASEDDNSKPTEFAQQVAEKGAAQGFAAALRSHEKEWERLWESDIIIPGHPEYQAWIHSAWYALYSSVRTGARWSVPPAGLSSDDYGGWLFWDADTWIFPTLLLTHPELARAVVNMRANALGQARENARALGYRGAVFPWNTGPAMRCPPNRYKCDWYEEHLANEIALAQWQYYLSTNDKEWLAQKGGPVITAIADYLVSRVGPPDPQGHYHYRKTAGADEYVENIDDHALTVAGAKNTLRIADRVQQILGQPVDAQWKDVANRLAMPVDIMPGVPAEYSGFGGRQIKQADTVLLSYPFDYQEGNYDGKATMDYYFPRTDPTGPNMTNGMGAILEAQFGVAGCAVETFLDQAGGPYIKGPFQMGAEVVPDTAGGKLDPVWNRNEAAWIFVTGQASFLQALLVAPTGIRLNREGIHLNPLLPQKFAEHGIRITGLSYHGSKLDVEIGPENTVMRLISGKPVTFVIPDAKRGTAKRTITDRKVLILPTRRPDMVPTDDMARCRAVESSASSYNSSPRAAVDGSVATVWHAQGTSAYLSVDLGSDQVIHKIHVDFGAHPPAQHFLEVTVDGQSWRTVGPTIPDGAHARKVRVRLSGPAPATGVTGIGKGSPPTLDIAEISVR